MSIFSAIRRGIAADVKFVARFVTRGSNAGKVDAGQEWYYSRHALTHLVDEDTALTLTAVYRAVSIIAGTIGGLPLHIYRENQFGEVELEEADSTAYLWYRPNPEMTRPFFWETVVSHEVLNGNAYLFVVKSNGGDPLELWPIHPSRVHVERREGRKLYFIDGEGEARTDFLAGGEIVHVSNMSRDGLIGLSPIRLASLSLELAQAAEEYGARFYAEDAVPPGLLKTDQPITPAQAVELREAWQASHGGPSRQIGVLGYGAGFQALSINPEDAQLIESRRFQVAEVSRIFGVPPHMLADMERSTSWGTGLEEQGRNFLAYCLQPHILRFESAIEDALLRRRQTRRKVRFVTEGLLRANYMQRMQGHATAHGRFFTANEIRKVEGFPPIEGGDMLLQMTNLAPAEALADVDLSPPEPPEPPQP